MHVQHTNNSPVHDEATWNAERATLDCEDVGLNSLLALEGEMLHHMAQALGDADTAARLKQMSDDMKARIQSQLWDEERQVFANRLWSGRFVSSLAPTSFYPLLAGAATWQQAQAMVERHLKDPQGFWGQWVLPSVRRDDPAFADNVYWRGRIWGPLNYLVYHGLRRYGLDGEATSVAERSVRLFMLEWTARRHCHENYNADTGEGCDSPDSDPFYTWGALLPWLGVSEVMDITPWHGWEINHTGAEKEVVGPVLTPAGMAEVEADAGWLHLVVDGRRVLSTNITGRIRHLQFTPDTIRMKLPPGGDSGASGQRFVDFPSMHRTTVLQAFLDEHPLDAHETPDGVRFPIPPRTEYATLTVYCGRR